MNWYKKAQKKKCKGWLAVRFNVATSKRIQNWGKRYIPEEDIHTADDHGREDDIHITLIYGLCADDPNIIKAAMKEVKPIKATLNNVGYFRNKDNFDVVIIKVDSPDLVALNKELTNTFNIDSDYNEYKPHCTIAYVKNGKAAKYAGDTTFDGIVLKFNKIVFINNKNEETEIKL